LPTYQELRNYCYVAELRGTSFDRKTVPVTKPTKAGKINMKVQPWTFPVVISRRKETALAAQQSTPLGLVWTTGSCSLSINEPTIANKAPSSSDGKID
jgi:hypothetical protein